MMLQDSSLKFLNCVINGAVTQIGNSKRFLQDQYSIQIGNCFRPQVHTCSDPLQTFPIFPQYSARLKYIQIDIQVLKYLLKGMMLKKDVIASSFKGTVNSYIDNERHTHEAQYFSQVFNLDRLQAKIFDIPNSKQYFTNVVCTDGFGIDFICVCSTKSNQDGLPGLDLEDFSVEEIAHEYHHWAADPGLTNIYSAVDGHGDEEPHQYRKFSAKEFYHLAGFDITNDKIAKYRLDEEGLVKIESKMPSPKTTSLTKYQEYIKYRLHHLPTLFDFYDQRFIYLRFLNYIGRQRAGSELVNILCTGGIKYANNISHKRQANNEQLQGREPKHYHQRVPPIETQTPNAESSDRPLM